MLKHRDFLIVATLVIAVPVTPAFAQKIWSPSEVSISLEACPKTTSENITVVGLIEMLDDGTMGEGFSYNLIDERDRDSLDAVIVVSKQKLNVQDNTRISITGTCTRKGSFGDSIPLITVDHYKIL